MGEQGALMAGNVTGCFIGVQKELSKKWERGNKDGWRNGR